MAVELLVKVSNDAAGGFVRGTVVMVKQSPARWGINESIREWVLAGNAPESYPGVFVVVKTDALDIDEAKRLLEPEVGVVIDPELPPEHQEVVVALRPRRAKVDFARLSPTLRVAMGRDDGAIAVSRDAKIEFLNAVRNITDDTIHDITQPRPVDLVAEARKRGTITAEAARVQLEATKAEGRAARPPRGASR